MLDTEAGERGDGGERGSRDWGRLSLYSLEFRRMKWNLIDMYSILTGLDRLDAGVLFPLAGRSGTRSHSLRIRGRTDIRRGGDPVEFSTTDGCGGHVTEYTGGGNCGSISDDHIEWWC